MLKIRSLPIEQEALVDDIRSAHINLLIYLSLCFGDSSDEIPEF